MLLGEYEDVMALQGVLEQLSDALNSNRSELDTMCHMADTIGGVSVPAAVCVAPETIDEEEQHVAMVQEALELALSKLRRVATLLQALKHRATLSSLEMRYAHDLELEAWKQRVCEAAARLVDVEAVELELDRQLVKLLKL